MRRRDDEQVRAALRDVPAPGEGQAEERGWAVVREAFTEREPVRPPLNVRARAGLAALVAGLVAVVALTPAGAEVREWIADAIEVGEEDARPVLGSLPASGSVLVESGDGAWVLNDDGSRRNLGEYRHVTWSPNGLYVGAAEGRELFALTPQGDVRWSLIAPARISAVDWSSDDGFRVAYVAGRELRIVAGDGSPAGDPSLAGPVGATAIAWRPETLPTAARHELAYVDDDRRVVLVNTDTRQVLWRSEPVPAAGREPAVVGRRGTAADRSGRLRLARRRPRQRAVQGARRNGKCGHARGRRPADRRRPPEPCRQGRTGAHPHQPCRGPGARPLPDQPGQGRSRLRHAHVLSRRRVDPAALARGGPVALHPHRGPPSRARRRHLAPARPRPQGLRDVPARRRMVLLRYAYA